ncbi:uncharacterized protein LOC131643138 [Vicia villosa]|uniref:uncharacterized protein LOC131643138 n=1 Tax=Vicia villosa TaxID=3911 RepID=UPI00273B9522|nr:uncharacterized protein LOC131643138 [Vicia villosa]
MFPKVVVSNDAKSDKVKDKVKPEEVKEDVRPVEVEIDVGQQFTYEQLFTTHEHMFEWVRMVVENLEFGIVIGRSDNGSNQRQAFVTLRCERSGMYVSPIQKLKRDDSKSRKFGHLIVCRLKLKEKVIVSDMSLISVAPKNILADLKRKRPESVSNIKQVYNAHYRNNMAIRGPRSKMQQRLKFLDDNHYVSREDFSVGFTFLESEKKDNVTWALEMCKTLLKDRGNMSKVISTDLDTALMNLVAKVFPTSYTLLC